MSYASGTTHYNLPQTVGSDKRDWTDTNQAFSDIDAAIYGAAQGASAATSAIETINGEIETITGKQAVDESNISTLAGKVSTLESTVGTQAAAIADVRQDLQDNIESKKEASATSTHAYNVGDTFYYNDVLYKATAPIAIGGTIVPSTNCTAVTVMSEIQNQTAAQISYDGTTSGLTADDVQEAIDELASGGGKYEYTCDGVKAYTAILNEIFSAIDKNKITTKSTYRVNQSVCHISFIHSSLSEFHFCCVDPSDHLYTNTYILNASTSKYYSGTDTTITNSSSVVPPEGTKITIVY